jgi:hypothetical protein
MKQIQSRPYSYGLGVAGLSAILTILSFISTSFTSGQKLADDLWKQLGISQQQGSDKIKTSFMEGYLNYWGVKNFTNLAVANRGAVAKDLLIYTRSYLESPNLAKAYAAERQSAKPVMDELKTLSKDEIRKREIENFKKVITNSENLIKQFPEMEKSVRQSIDEINRTIKEFESPQSEMVNIMYEGQLMENKYKEERYQQAIKAWEENFPSDHRMKLRSYLQKYLSLAGTVDFDAALVEKNGKRVFMKSEFEGKNDEWKMIFRAGRDVYEVAKPFAEQWLKDLPVSK